MWRPAADGFLQTWETITGQKLRVSGLAAFILFIELVIQWRFWGASMVADTLRLVASVVGAIAFVFVPLLIWNTAIAYERQAKNGEKTFNEATDPHIIPECHWAIVRYDQQVFQDRPITLENRGKSDAKNIRIADIVTPHGRAKFPQVGYLKRKKHVHVRPDLENAGLMGIHDLLGLLDKDWRFPPGTEPVRTQIAIQYESAVGSRCFMTTAMIVRDPMRGTTEIHNSNVRRTV